MRPYPIGWVRINDDGHEEILDARGWHRTFSEMYELFAIDDDGNVTREMVPRHKKEPLK